MSILQEIIEGMKSGSIPSRSEFNLMNEKRQERVRGYGLKKFQYEWKKKSRIFMSMQLAIPFDPEIGKVTEVYNANMKWRPPLSASTSAMVIKSYANQNEDVKHTFMTRAGVSEWDVSDPNVLNDVDFEVLRGFRVPITLTSDTISVSDKAITGQEFGIRYSVNIEVDPDTGMVVGELPDIAKIGNFMAAVNFNELAEMKKAVKDKDPGLYHGNNPEINPNSIAVATEDNVKDWTKAIFKTAIISSPQPSNFLLGFEFPLSSTGTMVDKKGVVLPDYLLHSLEDIKSHAVYFDSSSKYTDFIKEVIANPALDHFWDFIEFDLCDATAIEPKDTEKGLASRNLKPAAASHSLWSIDTNTVRFPWVNDLCKGIADFRDSDPEFEKKMVHFLGTRLKPADEVLTASVADRLKKKLPIWNQYIDKTVFVHHKDAIYLVYQEDALERAIDLGLEEADSDAITESEEIKEIAQSAANIMSEIQEEIVAQEEVSEEISDTEPTKEPVSAIEGIKEIHLG